MQARPESDEVLVKRLLPSANGDPMDRTLAWGEWYVNEGETTVMAFVKAKNDTSEPDMDIFQEAMLTAFLEVERGRYKPRVGIPFAAYVKGIARNKIREARRRARHLLPLDDTPPHFFESDQLRLETVVERQEDLSSLRTGLTKLPRRRRQFLEGYLRVNSTAEIAELLGMTEELVRQHKSRGLRRLRQMSVFAATG